VSLMNEIITAENSKRLVHQHPEEIVIEARRDMDIPEECLLETAFRKEIIMTGETHTVAIVEIMGTLETIEVVVAVEAETETKTQIDIVPSHRIVAKTVVKIAVKIAAENVKETEKEKGKKNEKEKKTKTKTRNEKERKKKKETETVTSRNHALQAKRKREMEKEVERNSTKTGKEKVVNLETKTEKKMEEKRSAVEAKSGHSPEPLRRGKIFLEMLLLGCFIGLICFPSEKSY